MMVIKDRDRLPGGRNGQGLLLASFGNKPRGGGRVSPPRGEVSECGLREHGLKCVSRTHALALRHVIGSSSSGERTQLFHLSF